MAAFRAKYGFRDVISGVIRLSAPYLSALEIASGGGQPWREVWSQSVGRHQSFALVRYTEGCSG